jgi:uncharacterized membrane protein
MSPIETSHAASLVAIFAMTAVTYFLRTSGFWIMGHVPLTARVRRMLDAMPGSIVFAIVLPIVVKNGLPAMLAVAVVIAAMVIRRNDIIAVTAGLATVAIARAMGL